LIRGFLEILEIDRTEKDDINHRAVIDRRLAYSCPFLIPEVFGVSINMQLGVKQKIYCGKM